MDDNTGAVDLVIAPGDPNTLYAATWTRERRAWNFVESGTGSGIYKSTNGGKTWSLLTKKNSGFPSGEGVGRIGLDIGKDANGKTVLYAALDNYDRRPEEPQEEETLTKAELRKMSTEDFAEIKDYLLDDFLRGNAFPRKFNAAGIKKMIRNNELTIEALVAYTEDANSLLFDTPVIGLEIYRSDDDGRSWQKTHDSYIDFVYNSYGYYFGQIRINPSDINKIYVLGVPVIRSDDGGKTFKSIGAPNVHSDHHALWINPKDADHLILGNDGGANISYDDGTTWNNCNMPPVGQFYAIAVDMAEPYRVYGGLQDNGVWVGPSNYRSSRGWMASGQYSYREILGGDGMQVAVDTRDNNTVYTGFQFGNYFRINLQTEQRKSITPKHELGERPLRWNWQAPIHLSVHNQDILYMGSNKLHRSFNQGDDFQEISDDLTNGGRKGDVAFGTLTTIHESPLRFGLIYTGSDDGLVHVTRDGGFHWEKIMKGLPENLWVSRVQASAHAEGRVYLSLNGYRWDDFKPYTYSSDDYGQTWTPIGKNLPPEPVNVIKEDPKNEDILYVGTDNGLYISLDRGKSFHYMDNNLPAVAVHDVVVHPRTNELIVGTHGRSLYLADMTQIQQFDEELLAQALHIFDFSSQRYSSRWGRTGWFAGSAAPQLEMPVYAGEDGEATIRIKTTGDDPLLLKSFTSDLNAGLNFISYDLTVNPEQLDSYKEWLNRKVKENEKPVLVKKADNGELYLRPGKYTLEVEKGSVVVKKELEVK
ncbi:MAG: glycosyl hydrolase [Saprospiraceae bacterium]